MENNKFSDVPTSQKHCKYNCFHYISLVHYSREIDGFRHLLGPHFGGFWRSSDTILIIFEVLDIATGAETPGELSGGTPDPEHADRGW